LLRATAVVVGGSAALLTGGIAHADTAPPAPVPNLGSIGQQLANAPQLLQGLTSALGGAPATPPTPPPMASADIRVPQLPANVPGASALAPPATSPTQGTPAAMPGLNSILPGATPSAPATAPAATAPTAGPGLMPNAQVSLPNVPFSPVPLPQQVSLPGDLASLAPGGVPIPRGMTPPTAPVPSTATAPPAVINNPILIPLSALP